MARCRCCCRARRVILETITHDRAVPARQGHVIQAEQRRDWTSRRGAGQEPPVAVPAAGAAVAGAARRDGGRGHEHGRARADWRTSSRPTATSKPPQRQAVLEELDALRARAPGDRAAHARAGSAGDRLAHPVADPRDDGQVAARVLPAPAAAGDPQGAGRDRRERGGGWPVCASDWTRPACRRRRAKRPTASSNALVEHPDSQPRALDGAHVPGVAGRPALEHGHRRTISICAHAKRVLDEDHHDLDRVKERILEFLAVMKLRADVASGDGRHAEHDGCACEGRSCAWSARRAWARRQPGPVIARALGRKFVRMSLGGVRDEAEIRGHRRTYIGAMPGRHHPGPAPRGPTNPVVHAGRDRQAGRRLARRPVVGAARGARPGAEQRLPRSLPGRAVRPVAACCSSPPPTCWTPSHRRCAIDWRSSSCPATPRTTSCRSPSATWCRDKQSENGLRCRARQDHRRGAATVIREYTREAGVRNLEREIATLARKSARAIVRARATSVVIDAPQAARDARPAALPAGGGRARGRSRRGDRTGVDAGRRRGAVHRGARRAWARATCADRPAGRRDEGVGAGGADLRPLARRVRWDSARRSVRRARTSTSTCPPARCRRMGRARASRWPRRSSRR